MKKLAFLAVGAILFLGAIAIGAVLLATGGEMGGGSAPSTSSGAGAPSGPSGTPAAAVPLEPPKVPGQPPGPRLIRLNPVYVKSELTEPLRPCFLAFPPVSDGLATLALDMEARPEGGFTVMGSRVKLWGQASAGLVACVQQALLGKKVSGSALPAGEHAEFEYSLEIPESIVPPPPEPTPASLPANRQSPPRRSGSR